MTLYSVQPKIRLEVYNDRFKNQLEQFNLPDEQLQFTSMPLDKIHRPDISKNTLHVLILQDVEPVGYFALEDGEKLHRYSTNPNARLLTSFSIDRKYQGKGLAKKGLSGLQGFVRDHLPGVDEVVLGVNKRNHAAYTLYLKCGFEDRDEEYVGPKGPQHVLHLSV
ncbi:GNAT family N-acetyltransferase [Rossellomorea aquimaris]|uniref:GNAT family N-acetyltransferase n=1 Tax=Rossellomorea aquimaris TaxID=189382 RepID=UPI001CD69B70|nr:GNAT family N-acetyltransferase [Rossellomorea aquimaris]MCA1054414.1 GNAT family N-acetyltransferase [Rossellomorea aquimaris]